MDSKQAAEILIEMMKKHKFSPKEKEAILTAIGVLGWTALGENRIKARRAKRGKENK